MSRVPRPMRFYLSRYTGQGSPADPFRPSGVAPDQTGWSSIDLRPDPTQTAGFALVHAPVGEVGGADVDVLTDDPDDSATATRLLLQSRLGVTLDAGLRFRRLLRQLLLPGAMGGLARMDGSRWKPLRPEKDAWRIWLGGLVDEVPVVAGGATQTDDFNRADGDAPGGSWTEVVGDFDIVSNKMRAVTTTGQGSLRWDADLDSVDHYSQASVTWTAGTALTGGTCVRFASAAETFYVGRGNANANTRTLIKVVTGTLTSLDSQSQTINAETLTVKTTINGSTLSVDIGAGNSSITDTAISTGTRAGLFASSNGNIEFDTWEAADLAAGGQPTMLRWRHVPHMRVGRGGQVRLGG